MVTGYPKQHRRDNDTHQQDTNGQQPVVVKIFFLLVTRLPALRLLPKSKDGDGPQHYDENRAHITNNFDGAFSH
jgi:hypothetical protein